MIFRQLAKKRGAIPAAAVFSAAGLALYPQSTAHAEAPESAPLPAKKPIYDDLPPPPPKGKADKSPFPLLSKPTPDTSSPLQSESTPTVTDLLAGQIKLARLHLYRISLGAETHLNAGLTRFLHLEDSFISTIADLAPPRNSNEKLLPGSVYVLVSAMAGSIVTRNRNIFLRFTVPLAVGIGAGWVVLPITMRNIGDLCWRYEERVPVVKDVHLRTRAFVEEAIKVGKEGSKEAVRAVESGAQSVRESVGGLVSGKK